ncbi:T9SS type A sorting domain-containing protein [Winogradskyella sp. R77965]|uniref:T9SS type A sorting domain-containing protein n=1 Tax=Winogradskyella sp. R77965 TaxID=3093872 RepID=UPI0037DD485E
MKKTLLTILIFAGFSNLNFAQTTWEPIQNIDTNPGNQPTFVVSGDLDGDTDIDIAIGTYDFNQTAQDYIKWYKNDGNGNFELQTSVSESVVWVQGMIIADVDALNNNGNDIIATVAFGSKLVYYPNNGSGGFGAEVVISNTINSPGQVVSGDINNDGNLDLAVASYTDNNTIWFMGDGLGGFVEQTASPIQSGGTGGPWYLDIGDFDGDSDLDVVVGFFNTGNIEIYYNQYVESGTSNVSWIMDDVPVANGNSWLAVPTHQMAFADVNNDDVMDVIKLNNSTGDVEWFSKIKNGASTPNTISDSSIIARPGTVVVADLDDDGNNDVILTDGGSADDSIIWFKGADGANPSSTASLIDDNNFQFWAITVNDFDGDSDLDIAAVGVFSDALDWYENNLNSLSIADVTLQNVTIYPNPANSIIHIKGLTNDVATISVTDMLGRNVLTKSLYTNETLDVSQLVSGIYSISIDGTFASKFIKE